MKTALLLFLILAALACSLEGQTLISSNQPATASGYQTGNYPTNGNDGNLTTRWAAADATYPQWWQVDLGSTQAVTQAIIYWYSSASRAYQYQIQISDDNVNFSVLVNNTNNSAFGNTTNTFSALARYVRIYVTGCSDAAGFAGFYECEILGAAPLQPSPHAPDAYTLFLFHLDEPAGKSVTTNAGTAGGNAYSVSEITATTTPPVVANVLGAASYTGFGNAAAFTAGTLLGYDYNNNGAYNGDNGSTLSTDAMAMTNLNMGNGGQTPWTLEAMICPSAINTTNQEIICTDSSAGTRGFQFRITYTGYLELNLIGIGADMLTPIPTTTTDPVNGFVANNWYHVAAAYDGTNVVFYWTKVSATVTADNPISTNAVAVGTAFGAAKGPLIIGNRNRNVGSEYFQGLIDEVRISSVARAPTAMLNLSGVPAIGLPSISPTNSPIYAGTPVTLSGSASGTGPLFFQWQTDGGAGGTLTNIPGAATNIYTFNTTGMAAGVYRFDLAVSNSYGAATGPVITMNLAAPSGPALAADTTINPAAVYAGSPVSLTAAFTGSQPISYQWFFGSVPIAGATNATYAIASAQVANAGSYYLMASNNVAALGSRTSASTPATLTVAALVAGATQTNTVSGLLCNLLAHPEQTIITTPIPTFGWDYQPFFRSDGQTGYRIIVRSSLTLATAGMGDLWDSGFIISSNSINVPYAGAASAARQKLLLGGASGEQHGRDRGVFSHSTIQHGGQPFQSACHFRGGLPASKWRVSQL